MFEHRITKYDPAWRDARGAYTRDEWTSFRDIGRTFSGQVLTPAEYQRVEDGYVSTALALLREAGVGALSVEGLEAHDGHPPSVTAGASINLSGVAEVVRRVLREEF